MSEGPLEERQAALQERIQALPASSGVYLFRDVKGVVLYVGKAQSLRVRVRNYFSAAGDGRLTLKYLVPRIADVEVVATSSVKEALLLENELIKKHKPRFNVRLRDDKNYLALRLDPRENYPRFTETRKFLRDGALYFGPYTSSRSLRDTLDSLQRLFPLRTCSDSGFKSYQRRGRPCLEHAVGRCAGPCCGLIEEDAYEDLVKSATLFMRGRADDVVGDLRQRMEEAAQAERFEEASRFRDRLQAIERTVEHQSMISTQFTDRDVFAMAREGNQLEIQLLHVRMGKLLGGSSHSFRDVRIDDAEALDSFLSQYYSGDRDLPLEVLLPLEVEGREFFETAWRERAGRAVKLLVPKRGEGRRLVEMAQRNAALALTERTRRERNADELLEALKEVLRLDRIPERIECYDISHLQGALTVASRVVFVDGDPHKDGYRRYKLRETQPGDDYGAMREVLGRRLARRDTDPVPDLLLLDGGKGQLGIARALVEDLQIEGLSLASLAKERDDESPSPRVMRHGGAKRERVFLPNVKDPILLPADSPALMLLQRVRDESHRFAIRYHRELRSKAQFRSILDELPGIGPVKRRSLLRTLGSLERIRNSSAEELAAVPKISQADGQLIHRFFRAATDDTSVKNPEREPDPIQVEGGESKGGGESERKPPESGSDD
ncbi:MAG: excinuclease ABC subunit UvrC [bacterium]|nr:excinuclease ABC subunit UvrC [bacterium]